MRMNEERLFYWDKLLRGEGVDLEKVRAMAVRDSTDAPEQEKAAWVLLLAAAELLKTGSPASRCYLIAYLRYCFSQAGTAYRPPEFDPESLKGTGIDNVLGTKLTWEEALVASSCKSKKGRSVDYSAMKRTEAKLKLACRRWWEELFGSLPRVLEGGERDG